MSDTAAAESKPVDTRKPPTNNPATLAATRPPEYLDRTREFGTYRPYDRRGRVVVAFEQDGKLFDPEGLRVYVKNRREPDDSKGAIPPPTQSQRKPPWRRFTKTPEPAGGKRRRMYPSEEGYEGWKAKQEQDAKTPFAQEDSVAQTVNLREWAFGRTRHRFAEVQAAIAETCDVKVTDERGALKALFEGNILNGNEYDQLRG